MRFMEFLDFYCIGMGINSDKNILYIDREITVRT